MFTTAHRGVIQSQGRRFDMPIESCTLPDGGSGFRWGKSGKCYASRKEAEKQAAAIYASGYAGKVEVDNSLTKENTMKLFAQIQKVDEEKRLVYGRAADETPDKSKEKMDYDGSKPHFQKWSTEMSKDTDGKSLGNVRAMHGKVAAGVLKGIDFDDTARTIDVCAKVVDDNEWKKVLEGVYTGFSIGGAYGPKSVEKIDGEDYTKYVAIPNEISLVDRPCIPTAKFFQVQKADGSVADVEFKEPAVAKAEDDKMAEGTVDGTPEQVDELTALMAEKGLSLGSVIDLLKADKPTAKDEPPEGTSAEDWAKMTPAEKAECMKKKPAEKMEKLTPSQLRKGMYECARFAELIAALQGLKMSTEYESYREGDNSPVPQALGAVIQMCAGVLKQMIDEEVAEAGEAGLPQPVMQMAEQCGALAKVEGEDPLLTLVKYGARNSGQDKSRIDSIHKAAVELGAECAPATKAEGADDLQKREDQMTKLIADAVTPLQKALDAAHEKITKLEAQPMPTKVSLRAVAVSKAEDNGEVSVNPTEADLVKDAHGAVHPAASLIKQAQAQGGAPMTYHG